MVRIYERKQRETRSLLLLRLLCLQLVVLELYFGKYCYICLYVFQREVDGFSEYTNSP